MKTLLTSDHIPVIPPLPPQLPSFDPNPTVAVCGECGLQLKAVMGFVCRNQRCPCGLGSSTTCQAQDGSESAAPVGQALLCG